MDEYQKALLKDPWWRLNHLYWIQTDDGREIRFRANEEQAQLYRNLWYCNVILKARQLGFTTLLALLALDQALFRSNFAAGFIAHNLEDAKKIFRRKIKFAYDRLPKLIRDARPVVSDTSNQLVLPNGSEISVGTSMRSGTLQFLHISEYGKICRKFPDKAEEIKTGALNAVHAGQFVAVESTAEGRSGDFHELCQKSRKLQEQGATLTPLDFRFHFFPWWRKDSYRIAPKGVILTREMKRYFEELEADHGIKLDVRQKAWYIKKSAQMGDKMFQEFPSHPDESFHVAIEGAYYGKLIQSARSQGRIRQVPHVKTAPVNTFWDLGRNDVTAIWFHQDIAQEHRFIRYFENNGEDLAYYAKELQKLVAEEGYIWGYHYLPHDAHNKNLERNESRVDRLVQLGIPRDRIVVVPRCVVKNDAIEAVRKVLPRCWFDAKHCDVGLKALEEYQKKWNEHLGCWHDYPLHNWASNGADAFAQFAQGYQPPSSAGQARPVQKKFASGW